MRLALLAVAFLATAALNSSAPTLAQECDPDVCDNPWANQNILTAARDIPYPGTIRLDVDASDTSRGIYRVVETIPVRPGPLVLLYPQWLPGNHGPSGPIASLAGLRITANGRPVEWRRDPGYVYAFHVEVPAGVRELRLEFQHVSPTDGAQGRITMTPVMLNLQWEKMSLYPSGHFTRRINVQANVTYPPGWSAATSLNVASRSGSRLSYAPVPYETLVDSPVFAGRYYRREDLGHNVALNVFADEPGDLAATPAQIEVHRRLVEQELRLFGTQHFSHYEILLALTDELGGIGLEHLRSSENSQGRDYFTGWANGSAGRDLLAHETTHSWDGKYRRPADLWTPTFNMPMRGSLLWVYEGQTQFWGNILAARSGLMPAEDVLQELARTAAYYDTQPGRSWRPLADTTNDPILQARRPQPWGTYMRSEDYYSEGMLIWLEVDAKLRQLSGGRRSINDFARAFFGINPGQEGISTYRFEDVVRTLNGVAAYDWAGFLRQRVERTGPAPLAWIEAGGYRLVYRDTPTPYYLSRERDRKILDLTYSIGATIGEAGRISAVAWGGALFDAGGTVGASIVAVNDRAYSNDRLREAIRAAQGNRTPIRLLVKRGDHYNQVALDYHGGLRYPALERVGTGPSSLDALLAPL